MFECLRNEYVYAFDKNREFRLEYFETKELLSMLETAAANKSPVVGITHSYLLDEKDIVAKNRNGEVGTVKMKWLGKYQQVR